MKLFVTKTKQKNTSLQLKLLSVIFGMKRFHNIYYLCFPDYENENQQGENYIDCNEIRERRTEDFNKVCRYDLMELGADCVKQQNFGFDDGQPCILLKLNKVNFSFFIMLI